MGFPTPLHERTSALCKSLKWKEWAGYFAVERYGVTHDEEYFAIRETAGLLDVSPLYKYDFVGKAAETVVNRILARDVSRMKDGQVAYCCWCEEDGNALDDGTVFRFSKDHFRISAANPSYLWFSENLLGLDVKLTDRSASIAALALQGPMSRDILKRACRAELDSLGYFRMTQAQFDGFEATVSRTGFTGDLGYEIWVEAGHATALWDQLLEAGAVFGIMPIGLLALDMARIEAGFMLIDVDFKSSAHCITPEQRSNPYEIGLGWTVHLDKRSFVGQRALRELKAADLEEQVVGLEIDMVELEKLYERKGLPVSVPGTAWRCNVPLWDLAGSRQIGRATSGVWSPLLKKYICIATVDRPYIEPGSKLLFDTLVDYERKLVGARVVEKPFFDPERKKAVVQRELVHA
ncbi:MAG: aminomethyl transferase family protein [Armatimonadetes bacterium]|nr:aminomethyl transferase family protein [Armatimonadota bacterium]